ncbi:ubiquitin carboxyl-terminal hydrolase Usp2 isoform X2 [Drosophila busckii]|uniref:ubiquitin carboxyl-terminal hydrolase Usp2 isoform X2 n=1 Tax=Drosophila busckii TaxID=30019 RepID=UPI00083F0F0F|nr:ubiquitin carboxyl-terminal hydrolase Usp2 isoform X2 [Drosophila busckii]
MRVISPRRSSTSAAGSSSLYGTTSSSGSGSGSSSSTNSSNINNSSSISGGHSSSSSGVGATSNGYSRYPSSYYDRGSSLSKLSAASTSASSYNYHSSASSGVGSGSSYYPSSYTPRLSTQRNSIGSSSYLGGGASSHLSSSSSSSSGYRNSSYLSNYNNDALAFGRHGLARRTKSATTNGDVLAAASSSSGAANCSTLKSDDYGGGGVGGAAATLRRDRDRDAAARKLPPSGSDANGNNRDSCGSIKRLSSSCSSSSLARLVATSGLDMYEKYSPANYKPNCELSRSRSAVNEVAGADAESSSNKLNNNSSNDNSTTCTVTLDRPRSSRYSRLYSNSSDAGDNEAAAAAAATTTRVSGRSGSGKYTLSTSSSGGDVPTATFTLRSNRSRRSAASDAATPTSNGHAAAAAAAAAETSSSSNGLDAKLNGLSLLSSSPKRNAIYASDTTDDATATNGGDTAVTVTVSAAAAGARAASAAAAADENGDVDDDGDVSATATVTLGDGARSKSVRIGSSSSARSVLPPVSPTSSRYWDRDSGRGSSNITTTSIGSSLSSKHNSLDENGKSSRDEKSEGLCGLRNIGNTCFMNSVIQCLSHTTELTCFLRAYHASTRSSNSKDQQILHEFAKLIQEMWTSDVHSVTPMELKRAFSSKHRMYSDYNQQDAQEFLRFFLDSLHSALNSGIKGETLNIDDNLSDNKKADLTWEWYARHENSLIRDLFVGQLKSTLKCTTCGNTSVTFDPFWDLSVPLPSSSRCKLEACLDLFIREEVLDGDEMPTCAKCKTRRKCTKSFTIQRFPKYLVIHLKRFSETRWSKLSNIVEFPTGDRELNMASYGANANSNVHYSLYAISNHMGSTASGHYVALCKHPVSRKWHEFNDNSVTDAIPEHRLVSSSAYILFYERA